MAKMNDKSTSSAQGGKAAGGTNSRLGLPTSYTPGVGKTNNGVAAYRAGIEIMTDPMSSRVNIVAVPGIRDSYVTDYASDLTRDYSKAMYLMDIPSYDQDKNRLFDDSTSKPNVDNSVEKFDGRAMDNNYVATYFQTFQ